jgi:hypothetical protein
MFGRDCPNYYFITRIFYFEQISRKLITVYQIANKIAIWIEIVFHPKFGYSFSGNTSFVDGQNGSLVTFPLIFSLRHEKKPKSINI